MPLEIPENGNVPSMFLEQHRVTTARLEAAMGRIVRHYVRWTVGCKIVYNSENSCKIFGLCPH
jgi:hypothetical protein